MTEYVLVIVGRADGGPSEAVGLYVESYDPDAHDGQGDGVLTLEIRRARRFRTGRAALEFWRMQASPPHELRADGQPNRPLTSYTVQIRRLG